MATDSLGMAGPGVTGRPAAERPEHGEYTPIMDEETARDRNITFYSNDVQNQMEYGDYIPPHWSWEGHQYADAADVLGAAAASVFAFDADPHTHSLSFLDTGSPQTSMGLNGVTSTSIVLNENPPSNNMLNRKKLCIYRPEILASLDFKSVSETGFSDAEDQNTVLFNQRVTKRNMQLVSAISSLNTATSNDPDNYQAALAQYESSLAAASAEIALLKIAYTFKVYAQIGPSFSSFIKSYEFDPNEFLTVSVDTSAEGSSYYDYMNKTMLWEGYKNVLAYSIAEGKDASLLMQLIADLSFSCCFMTPKVALNGVRWPEAADFLNSFELDGSKPLSRILTKYSAGSSIPLNVPKIGLTRISRDLTASVQIGKIAAAAGDENETLKVLLEKYVENDYFTSTVKVSRSLFASIMGWDPWASVINTKLQVSGENSFQPPDPYYFVEYFKEYTTGLVSNLYTLDQRTLIASSDSDSYQSSEVYTADGGENYPEQSYLGTDNLVEEAFSSSSGIDLGLYEEVVTRFQDNLEDSAEIFKQLFKILDKRGSVLAHKTLTQSTHPTSPLNILANVIEVTNDRFNTMAPGYIGLEPSFIENTTNQSREKWYMCWGIFLILNHADIAKEIISKFVDDYNAGFLTFAETSETITYEDPSNPDQPIEYEFRSNVIPGTETSVNLSSTRGSLYNYLQGLYTTFSSEWDTEKSLNSDGTSITTEVFQAQGLDSIMWQASQPTNACTGTTFDILDSLGPLNTYFESGGDESEAASEFGTASNDTAIILAQFQNLHCCWAVDPTSGAVHPTGIIGIAAGVIDAVMTVLYNTLSPVMEISAAASTDPFFPAVESPSPPYHVQVMSNAGTMKMAFTDTLMPVAGMGNLKINMNTNYWVPVLNAIRENITRPEDKTTYFANSNIGDLLHGIVDAFVSNSPVASEIYEVWTAGYNSTSGATIPFLLNFPRPNPYMSAVPDVMGNEMSPELLAVQLVSGTSTGLVDTGGEGGITTALTTAGLSSAQFGNTSVSTYAYMNGASLSQQNMLALMIGQQSYSGAGAARSMFGAGYGIWLFGGIKNCSISDDGTDLYDDISDEINAAPTPSMMLNSLYAGESWSNVVINSIEFYETSLGVDLEIPTDEAGGTSVYDEYLTALLGSLNIPQEIWYMSNVAGGGFANDGSSYDPIGQFLDETLESVITMSGEDVPSACDVSEDAWYRDQYWGNNLLLTDALLTINSIVDAYMEDIRLGIGFDILDKYSQRISNYAETAIDGLTTSDEEDPSALEQLIAGLTETSGGIDVLQNLTPTQLNLKQAGLERLKGDPNSGYISHSDLISGKDVKAIQTMMNTDSLVGTEGINMKTNVIGIPSYLFKSLYSSDMSYSGPQNSDSPIETGDSISGASSPLYGIKVSGQLPDYPALKLIPKLFRFDYELFVLDDVFDDIDFENDPPADFTSLVNASIFTRKRFITKEGDSGASDSIVRIDGEAKEKPGDLTGDDTNLFDIYSNTLASYLLEKYYKLMVGLSLSEDEFNTAGNSLGIPINDYAVDFAAALSSIYTDLESGLSQEKINELFMHSSDIEALSYSALTPDAAATNSISTYNTMLSTFSTEIASGEFSSIEASLFEGFTNSASSRLMSAEAMRDKILSAKYFDRVVYVLVDPDEFLILDSESWETDYQIVNSTPPPEDMVSDYQGYIDYLVEEDLVEKVRDGYVTLGEIAAVAAEHQVSLTALDHDARIVPYKLKQRYDEGSLSFASWYCTVVRGTNVSDISGLTALPWHRTLSSDEEADLIIS